MKFFLEKAIFKNKAPFEDLELNFDENEVAVLSGINGRGKTTIISHIADAFFELGKSVFSDVSKGGINSGEYYIVSSTLRNLDFKKPAFVYLRFKIIEANKKEHLDYVFITKKCSEEDYNSAISLENKIPFQKAIPYLENNASAKVFSKQLNSKFVKKIFSNNLLNYFPSYRCENPGYLNDPYAIDIKFSYKSTFSHKLNKPIEIISVIDDLANWILDLVLDLRFSKDNTGQVLFNNLNTILQKTLSIKDAHHLRFGIGKRNEKGSRIQIVHNETIKTIYPSIFNLSSGEVSLLCIFGEILRLADLNKVDIPLFDITGIVLIDEVDKHLHIKLQKEVLPDLLKIFPNIQFILSSHSPFFNIGLAEVIPERSKIIDIENGLSTSPDNDEQYIEVYNMMISENENFKHLYDSIKDKLEEDFSLQIVTEGNNTEHIKKAISVINDSLLKKINFIEGAKGNRGGQQLKNAFEALASGDFKNNFLFVWDCDFKEKVDTINEAQNFHKFCIEHNKENTDIENGIENIYSKDLFTDDMYKYKTKKTPQGEDSSKKLDKSKFLEKIKKQTQKDTFSGFLPLIEKINHLIK